jgi:hypothetical protein
MPQHLGSLIYLALCTTDGGDNWSLIANIYRDTLRRYWATTVLPTREGCAEAPRSCTLQAPTKLEHCPATSSPHATCQAKHQVKSSAWIKALVTSVFACCLSYISCSTIDQRIAL